MGSFVNTDTISQACLAVLSGQQTLASIAGIGADALEVIYHRGYTAWCADNIDQAISDFGFLVLHQPMDYRFHFAFASALHQQGEVTNALNFYGYAAAMKANEPGIIYRIAECLYALDEVDATRDALDAVILLCYGQTDRLELASLRQHAEEFLIRLNK
ncbi:tetratricopeptide repeat protein [Chitinimonas sp. BJB300]|uniref:tetratricopeptide repeat protein n=1 Tax=Chitinimonas sp. BJB300 TaxID=1559339 RepID=UPI000C10F66E|nr:tetratricopeptide repeat protein [Chitinimonas sp. BJB300]PHV12417.1 CesD/SycD/LcrH family type III secretion system chaperone [Chitinimonas sp. BJB300]TSJ89016.1 tetratricopeptide repeat protein [Chitinimonas sp. BJB300]